MEPFTKEQIEKIMYFYNHGFGSAKVALLAGLDCYRVRNYLLENGYRRNKQEALEAKKRANKTPYATKPVNLK